MAPCSLNFSHELGAVPGGAGANESWACPGGGAGAGDSRQLNEFQIIKAVVLVTVTAVIMFSVCRMVFQLFVRYAVRQDR